VKFSARNVFPGTVKEVIRGPVSAEVTLTIAPGFEIVSVISTRSADALGLKPGLRAYGLVKASSVMVATD